MEAPLQRIDLLFAQLARQQRALVPLHRGHGEMGNIPVGQLLRLRKIGGQVAQAGAEHHGDLRTLGHVRADKFRALLRFFVEMFHCDTLLFCIRVGRLASFIIFDSRKKPSTFCKKAGSGNSSPGILLAALPLPFFLRRSAARGTIQKNDGGTHYV